MVKKIILLGIFSFSFLAAQVKIIDFSDVVDNLNTTKKTSLYAKNYWTKIVDQEVVWTGKVLDVKGNKRSAKIFIANMERPTYKGFNIILSTKDMDTAGMLDIGQRIKFRGYLDNYKSKKGGSSVIYLKDAVLLHTEAKKK